MADQKESVRDKIIVAVFQTLIFGVLLAIFGYWLNTRLETYKHELADQSEKTKVLLASLAPDLQLRRKAYADYQQAARSAKQLLEVYYYRADDQPEHDRRRSQIISLRNDLGIGSGSGAGVSLVTHGDAVGVVNDLIKVREQYEDVASDEINAVVDMFIDIMIDDLRASAKPSNDSVGFENAARKRLDQGFATLNVALEEAIGIDKLPVK